MMVPLALVPFVEAFGSPRVEDRIKLVGVAAICLYAVAVAQPNGAFTFGILAVLFAINHVLFGSGSRQTLFTPKKISGAIVILAVACVLWALMYFAPFMQQVVGTTWAATLSPLEATASGLLFMFTVRQGVQPFLSVMVVVGIAYALRRKRLLWLPIAYIAALLFYIISVSTDGPIKQVLTGFWYTDYNRTGAMVALFAIPLAAAGFASCVGWLKRFLSAKIGNRKSKGKSSQAATARDAEAEGSTFWGRIAAAVMVALCALCQFAPLSANYGDHQISLGLVGIHQQVASRYSWDKALTSEEDSFIKEVMAAIPQGSLVINLPSDGSCWSYGVEGINTYYRRSSNTGGRTDAKEAELIRTRLCDVATDKTVQAALEGLDAHYVMLLDDPSGDNPTKTSQRYEEEDWLGIEPITEDTPGFSLILSEGDMRLYRIE